MASNGETILAWTEDYYNGILSTRALYTSQYTAGTWQHPLSQDAAFAPEWLSYIQALDVAVNANGEGLLVWSAVLTDPEGESSELPKHLYTSSWGGGQWTHPAGARDHLDLGVPGRNMDLAARASAAVNSTDEALVAWEEYGAVYVATRKGGPWRRPADAADTVSRNDFFAGDSPPACYLHQALLADDGQGLVLWNASIGTFNFFKSQLASDQWTVPHELPAGLGCTPAWPDCTMGLDPPKAANAADGRMAVCWVQRDRTSVCESGVDQPSFGGPGCDRVYCSLYQP